MDRYQPIHQHRQTHRALHPANQIDPYTRPIGFVTFIQPATQPCSYGESGGEMNPNAAAAGPSIASLPGFSLEQIDLLTKLILAIPSDPESPLTSPAKHKRNMKTRVQYKRKKAQAQP